MRLVPVKTLTDIQEGDTLQIEGRFSEDGGVQTHVVQAVKVSEQDGTEIIFNKKLNHFFNLGMYLDGKSWVTNLYKVEKEKPSSVDIGVDFNGLRRRAVGSYNNLVGHLNSCLQDGRLVDVFPSDIVDDLDRLRESLAVLVSMCQEGEFDSLPLDIESFNIED